MSALRGEHEEAAVMEPPDLPLPGRVDRHHVLLQGGVGGEPTPTGRHGALEGRLARVGQPMEVQTLLGHAAVPAQVTLHLK